MLDIRNAVKIDRRPEMAEYNRKQVMKERLEVAFGVLLLLLAFLVVLWAASFAYNLGS